MAEGRLGRWSRLKQRGGADAREERQAREDEDRTAAARATAMPDAVRLPGGVRVRNFVPAMPPLAPDAEDGDDRLSRGIGHEENRDDPAPAAQIENDERDIESERLAKADADARPLTEEEKKVVEALPPIESLTPESDITPFMQNGVPEFLKQRALRAMWRINPLFGFRDGLDDYDEDFNIIDKIIPAGTGNYKVGRGFLSEEELQDMMPEEAKHAFDEDEDEGDDADDLETADSETGESGEAASDASAEDGDGVSEDPEGGTALAETDSKKPPSH